MLHSPIDLQCLKLKEFEDNNFRSGEDGGKFIDKKEKKKKPHTLQGERKIAHYNAISLYGWPVIILWVSAILSQGPILCTGTWDSIVLTHRYAILYDICKSWVNRWPYVNIYLNTMSHNSCKYTQFEIVKGRQIHIVNPAVVSPFSLHSYLNEM